MTNRSSLLTKPLWHCVLLLATNASAFQIIWNVPSQSCQSKYGIDFKLQKYGIRANDDHKFYGQEVVLYYHKALGLYPYVDEDGRMVNEGIPQAVNLTEHLRKIEKDLKNTIPDKNYSGLAVIDWEGWQPLWKLNWGNRRIYKRLSFKWASKVHPEWPNKFLQRFAKKSFEYHAKKFLLTTLQLVRNYRPQAKWGLYGYPFCQGKKPDDYECTEVRHLRPNKKINWIFKSSTALFPSIYLKDAQKRWSSTAKNAYVLSRLEEALKVRHSKVNVDGSVSKQPIYAYTKLAFNTYVKPLPFYEQDDLCTTIKQPADLGLDGVVIWSSSASVASKQNCLDFYNYVNTVLGNYAQAVLDDIDYCKERRCSNRGTCVKAADSVCQTSSTYFQYHCQCDRHWKGYWCQKPKLFFQS